MVNFIVICCFKLELNLNFLPPGLFLQTVTLRDGSGERAAEKQTQETLMRIKTVQMISKP